MKFMMVIFMFINLVIVTLILWNLGQLKMVKWDMEKTEILLEQGRIPNMVSAIYMKNRIFDTLFEVIVFSMAVFGIKVYYSSNKTKLREIEDENYKFLARCFAFLALILSIHLAMTGHLSPGGGFSAGVAGGTAILLLGMSIGVNEMERRFENLKVDRIERILLLIMIIMTLLEHEVDLHFGNFGNVVSGGLVPFQSLIIYTKVLTGVWMIIYQFMKHGGVF